jgi:hypothetical protein
MVNLWTCLATYVPIDVYFNKTIGELKKKRKPSVSSISFSFLGKILPNFQYHKIGLKKTLGCNVHLL